MSSNNPIQGPSYLDPIFPIPDGLINYQYKEVDSTSGDGSGEPGYSIELDSDVESDLYDVDDGEEEESYGIDVPNEISIVTPHIIRTLPSGMQVVDLVVDVEDIPGAINYEFRVVKM